MHRRDVLLQLSASGFIAAWPSRSAHGSPRARLPAGSPVVFLTDQPHRPADASFVVQVAPNSFLSPAWHVGVHVRSLRAALGPANALLLMGTLRDLQASVYFVHRKGEVELIGATLPAERWTMHARS